MSKFSKPLAFVDVETTGLDPNVAEIIEIAVIRENTDGTIQKLHYLIKPQSLNLADPHALEINGFAADPKRWDSAPLLSDVGDSIVDILIGCILVGHNVSFDEAMIKANLTRAGIDISRVPYHKIDTVTLVLEWLFPLGLRSASLDRVREFLRWSKEGAHTAEKDVEDTRRLFRLLWRLSWRGRIKIQFLHWILVPI